MRYIKSNTKQIFAVVLSLFCGIVELSAQTPTLIGEYTYTTKGLGAAGIPSFSYNIPAGKNRIMIVAAYFERDHISQGANYPGSNVNVIPPLSVGSANITSTSYSYYYYSYTSGVPSSAFFSNSVFFYRILNANLPTGNTTFSFPTLASKPPQSQGDDVVISISVFENVNQALPQPATSYTGNFPTTASTFSTLTTTASTAPVGTTQNNIVYVAYGAISQENPLTNSAEWTDIHSINSNNPGGRNLSGLTADITYKPNNEPDGATLKTIYRSGVTGNPTVTFSRTSNVKILSFMGRMVALLPLARPSVSGTVYRDNNGAVNIDGGGTGGGVWNIANTLYVNAVNENGNVIATALVETSGIFTFPAGSNLVESDVVRFQLSMNQGTVGQPAPARVLPSSWTTVGESTTGTGNDGNADGEFTVTVGAANLANSTTYRFGVTACNAGTSAPVVRNISNTCPSTTANLNSAHTGTTPSGTNLVWFTNNTHSGTALTAAQVASAGAGTYYAFYQNVSNTSCYSPASNLVTVTINSCPVLSCSGTANIPPNGTIAINGVAVTSASSGSVTTYPFQHTTCSGQLIFAGALFVGSNGSWSLNLTFDKPVNNLVMALAGTGANTISGNENFIFTTNGGPVSIYSDSPANCLSTINGNEILSGVGAESSATGGGGLFKITSPNNFTSLTINGAGGYQGSTLKFCSSSIVEACNAGTAGTSQIIASGTAPTALTLTGSTGAIQWQVSTDNVTFTNVASGGNAASYSPGTLTATRYYRAVVTTSDCTAISNVVTITTAICTNPPATGTPDSYTQTGISSLEGFGNGWPNNVPNGFIAIESKNQGFVVTRIANLDLITNPEEGMLVYDLSNSPPCVKLYNGSSWNCLAKDCN